MRRKVYQSNWINMLHMSMFFLILFQNCVFHKSKIELKIINKSNNRLYLGNLLSTCDSCDIMRDVRFQCTYKNSEQPMLRILNAKDSIQLVDKLLLDKIRVYVIKADSLDQYCIKGAIGDITKKNWFQIVSGNINIENKTCSIVIE